MQTYTDEAKAQVLLEWKAGGTYKGLSRKFNIPEATLRGWLKGQTRAAIAPKEKRSINDLAAELAAESFQAQIAILRLAQDRAWLERQDASSLAILFGVNADKLYRLLPAFVPPTPDRANGD